MSLREKTEWIAVDWGLTHLRVWVMGAGENLLAERSADQGMGGLTPEGFEPTLLALIEDFLTDGKTTPVICSGMVGSLGGWAEAPFQPVPCAPQSTASIVSAATRDPRIAVSILPGLSQTAPAPDVMRGEETQIAGFLQSNPKFDGVLVMPGTHSRWVHISAEEVVSFQTFLTGELYALIARQSVLLNAVAIDGWDDAAFEDGVSEAISRPESVAAKLFSLHAAAQLSTPAPEAARARLSGLLIGMELAATRPYWLGQNLTILGAPKIGAIYARALSLQGLQAPVFDAAPLTREGLMAAYDSLTAPAD
ncbi:2-dehydro-3-deoxygalactonokinase [Neptunicoccus cionae]|uniref:2-keto-3-deoxy-galactonokinase n=1 Tax=Neptunicoccus cionae TaxID=2035344 RepID=A0A916VP82_9RHOB|nr:2-dehydro-3-deoxygalactonokinase [Amylibacter cionae]GGA14749.1 2-keto-3-deoxy-galactonokinase [Amylibacter cionae]